MTLSTRLAPVRRYTGPSRVATGLGIYFDMADLTGNGYPDLLAPGKDGLYLFYNEGEIPQPAK